MSNLFYLIGRLNNYTVHDDNIELMIYYSGDDGDFTIPVSTNFLPKKELIDMLEEDMLIAIKGHITLGENNQLTVIAEKLSFLTTKKESGDNNESK